MDPQMGKEKIYYNKEQMGQVALYTHTHIYLEAL